MSTPFGGHPTFLQYLNWTILVGCTTKHGVAYTDDGGATRLLLIEAPNGNWMAVVGMADSERLLPTTIARFDRRLGIASPFFKIDGDDPPQLRYIIMN
jgi:hypothetical protein